MSAHRQALDLRIESDPDTPEQFGVWVGAEGPDSDLIGTGATIGEAMLDAASTLERWEFGEG